MSRATSEVCQPQAMSDTPSRAVGWRLFLRVVLGIFHRLGKLILFHKPDALAQLAESHQRRPRTGCECWGWALRRLWGACQLDNGTSPRRWEKTLRIVCCAWRMGSNPNMLYTLMRPTKALVLKLAHESHRPVSCRSCPHA